MTTEEKIEYIKEALETADEFVLDEIYEFLQSVEYWKSTHIAVWNVIKIILVNIPNWR